MVTAPETVRVIPELMLTVEATVTVERKVIDAQAAFAATVTVCPEAMVTASPEPTPCEL
jgi:hypothetical protein